MKRWMERQTDRPYFIGPIQQPLGVQPENLILTGTTTQWQLILCKFQIVSECEQK